MGVGAIIGIIIGVIVIILLFVFIGIYNGLVGLRNQVKNAWAQIDLVETVKGYAAHEKQTLENVTNARNMAQSLSGGGAGVAERGIAEGELSSALSRLMVVVENYPNLKANENFLALQEELTSTENKISFSRQFYNDSVLRYNNKIQMFPSNVIAGMTGFKESDFFETKTAEEREAPKVSFTSAPANTNTKTK
jgi:LemA protein